MQTGYDITKEFSHSIGYFWKSQPPAGFTVS